MKLIQNIPVNIKKEINLQNNFHLAFADSHKIHRVKEHNKRNKPILTQKQRNVGNVSVKREIQSAAESCEKKGGDPTTTKIMTAPNCRDAVGFSGEECHAVTSPNHPPWWENTAYWPRMHNDIIIPPQDHIKAQVP